jgi:hypothetical protein
VFLQEKKVGRISMKRNIIRGICVVSLIAISSLLFAEDDDRQLQTMIVKVAASQRRIEEIPPNLRDAAIVDGIIHFLVVRCSSTTDRELQGIEPHLIIGLVKNPRLGIVSGNITTNPLFLQYVFQLASTCVTDGLISALEQNRYHTVALFDQRTPNINLPIGELMEDLIGLYTLEDGVIYFEPNWSYAYFSKNGFMRLTPEILDLNQKN